MKRFSHTFAVFAVSLFLFLPTLAEAQNRFDALRYSNWYPGQDAINVGFGGASAASGLGAGSVLFNPATTAQIENSGFSISLSNRFVEEESFYRNNSFKRSDSQVSLGELSLVYKFPVEQGDLTVGVGYAQLADFNRTYSYDVFNQQNTITDFFLQSDYYFDAAFMAFAIDDFEGETDPVSVWREPFPFVGVQQNVMLEEWGQLGEVTAFLSTEFRENLFVGVSLGIPLGTYNYRLNFLETPPDAPNEYDVVNMFLEDEITARITGFNIRVGVVYKATDWLQIGFNAVRNAEYEVSETFSTFISTEFTDGSLFEDEFEGRNSYNFQLPNRYGGGLTISPTPQLQLSGSAEYVDYSSIEMANIGSSSLLDNTENRAIRQEFDDVINLRAGISFDVNESVTLRGGYGLQPSPRKDFADATRTFYSGGASLKLSQDIIFDTGLQLARWDDFNVMYEFVDLNNNLVSEVVQEKVTRFNFFAGIRLLF